MSSGSYFTIYRKYNAKATDDVINSLQKKYIDEYKSCSLLSNNKTDEEYKKELPLVLSFSYYNEDVKNDNSIEATRNKYLSILNSDKSYLEELLTWNFCSDFTSLKEYWNLDSYCGNKSQYIINKYEAELMLQACNYLLSNEWSDYFEKILNNKWIDIIANSNRGSVYFKYVYRKNKKALKEIEVSEDIDSAKYNIERMSHALNTFISSISDYNDSLILVYTVW